MSPEISIDLCAVYDEKFYSRPTLDVARDLVGAVLCRKLPDGSILHAPIVELEAYTADDPACHAYKGKTKRCEVMFGPAGRAYVYFIYGMYNCINVVTEADGEAGAVLIRALAYPDCNGPGKLCKTWQITREHNGLNLTDPTGELWIVKGEKVRKESLSCSIRVGISQAQDRLWRFFIKDHSALSMKTVKLHKPKSKSKPGSAADLRSPAPKSSSSSKKSLNSSAKSSPITSKASAKNPLQKTKKKAK